MRSITGTVGRLLSGGRAAWQNLRNRTTGRPSSASEMRLDAVEKAMQIQTTLNESVDVQIKLLYALLEKTQKKLQIAIIALIATATIAALALAAAWMR